MTAASAALAAFTILNAVRIVGYLPQILTILRDRHGAEAVSISTWAIFALSNVSTSLYAICCAQDWRMAGIFAANALLCLVTALAAWSRRMRYRRMRTARACEAVLRG